MMDLYFESAGMILTLITLGKTLEARAKGKTSDAITKLMNLAPKTATVERDGKELQVPVEEVQLGETLIVKAGESVPVDGIVIEGFSSVDESALTGESIPVEKHIGDKVIGATTSKSGYFKMQATKVAMIPRWHRSSGWWMKRPAPRPLLRNWLIRSAACLFRWLSASR
mgnify:CR=1 FL=1